MSTPGHSTVIIFAALALYASALLWLLLRMRAGKAANTQPLPLKLLSVCAAAVHCLVVYQQLLQADGINLSLLASSSLVAWFICTVTVLNNFRRPLGPVMVFIYPMALLMITLALIEDPHPLIGHGYSYGVVFHILSSILAYSVLAITAIQAILISLQEKRLRQHKVKGLLRVLPPIQTQEQMLFEMVWIGVIMLTVAIAAGAIYVDDLLAQHLAHKTVLSVLALCLFIILLFGHHRHGWRARTAVRWTLSGFACLALAFVGSKLVLEYILTVQ